MHASIVTAFRAGAAPHVAATKSVEPEEFTAETTEYFSQLWSRPNGAIADCFSENAPIFFSGTSEDIHQILVSPPPEFLALWRMSPVAFSNDGEHALILASFICGGTCGGGAYYLFERDGSSWTLVGHKRLWVS
jgi:hypothetical protein